MTGAAARLAGVTHRTPVMMSRSLDGLVGGRVLLKAENLQRTGSFKLRGAYNAVASLAPEVRVRGVVAFSSGNHAQAVALAARLHGVPATIVMPDDAPPNKLAATRGYGAGVVTYDRYRDDREAIARGIVRERRASLIPPFDHVAVVAGQGTAALELFADAPALDAVVVPVGGGGLVSGCAVVAAAVSPTTEVIGVEPAARPVVRMSLRRGERVEQDVPGTIADGQQTRTIGRLPFAIIRRHLTDVVVATDADLVAAMRFALERLKVVVEPSGAAGLAAVLSGAVDVRGRTAGVIVSGGNVSPERLLDLLT